MVIRATHGRLSVRVKTLAVCPASDDSKTNRSELESYWRVILDAEADALNYITC
jgi:hypothetical protein